MRKRDRNKIGKPDAILSADFHLREDTPECRCDDFMKTQIGKLKWLSKLQKQYNVPVLLAGDVFHKWKAPPFLLSQAQYHFPKKAITIPGNHDLPAHNFEQIEKSGYEVLVSSATIHDTSNKSCTDVSSRFSVTGFPFGAEWGPMDTGMEYGVSMIHEFVYCGRKPFPGSVQGVSGLIKKLPGYDLILVGDNHTPFVKKIGNTLIVNPGSFSRQTSAQIDHKPRVYLWYSESNTVTPIYVPIKKGSVSKTAGVHKKEIDRKITAFAEKLKGNFEIGMVFEANIKEKMKVNKIDKKIQKKVLEAIYGDC